MIQVELAKSLYPVFQDEARYRVAYGGRGSTKSWGFARMAVVKAYEKRRRILCARELQNSIKDSVHKLLADQIELLKLPGFDVGESYIRHANGSEFIFRGLRNNPSEIKSMEGIDIAWVEEAQKVSEDSWQLLIPTIRNEGSEIWVTFNPDLKTDAASQRFIENAPPNSRVAKINYDSNPWLTDELKTEMEYLKQINLGAYQNVWLGEYKDPNSGGAVVKGWSDLNKDRILTYDPTLRLYLSCDFNVDPMCWVVAHRVMTPNGRAEYQFIDELCIPNTNIVQTAEEFARRYKKHKADIVITGDATGKNRSDASPNPNDTKYKILERTLSDNGLKNFQRDIHTSNPHEDIRVETWNALICNGLGVRRIRVNPDKCPKLVWNMENLYYIQGTSVIFEPTPKQIEKDVSNTLKYTKHPFDAASYLTYRYDPIRRDAQLNKPPQFESAMFQPGR